MNAKRYVSDKDFLSFDDALKLCSFAVESTPFEQDVLRTRYNKNYHWADQHYICNAIIGDINGRRVSIQMNVYKIEDVYVLFWHPTSTLIDYDMIEKYLRKQLETVWTEISDFQSRTFRTDNFHVVINKIRDEHARYLAEIQIEIELLSRVAKKVPDSIDVIPQASFDKTKGLVEHINELMEKNTPLK
jgi:hypothetical protein